MSVTDNATAEPAGIWLRVSSGGQDEQNQVPNIEKHCAARSYGVKRRYEVCTASPPTTAITRKTWTPPWPTRGPGLSGCW